MIVTLSPISFGSQRQKPKPIPIESLLGKAINDPEVQSLIKDAANDMHMTTFAIEDTYYYSSKTKGISLLFNKEDRIKTIFLYSEGRDGYKQYSGPIPRGFQFADTRATVNKKLGLPARSGGGDDGPLGRVPIWDKYRFSKYAMHFQYRPAGTIELITLMLPENDPN